MAKRKKKTSVMSIYAVAIAWVVYSLCFPLYELGHFITATVFSLICRGIAMKIWKPKYEETVPKEEKPAEDKQPEPEPAPSRSSLRAPAIRTLTRLSWRGSGLSVR